jgi:aspartyl-tRNA(Asn)/glutamyl-tRNA(Gln) amidotransferase subunit B
MMHELLGQLTSRKQDFQSNTLTVQQLAELIDLVQGKILTGTSAKYLMRHMLSNPSNQPTKQVAEEQQLLSPEQTQEVKGASLVNDLEGVIQNAMESMPKEVAALKAGHMGVLNKIVGRVMKESRGRADAKSVKEVIERVVSTTP